jgi:hypothetical protein
VEGAGAVQRCDVGAGLGHVLLSLIWDRVHVGKLLIEVSGKSLGKSELVGVPVLLSGSPPAGVPVLPSTLTAACPD